MIENQMIFTASCAAGLESLVVEEVKSCRGKEISPAKGMVSWKGNLESGYRLCLWSRFSSRVFMRLLEFGSPDTEAVYRMCSEIDWSLHIGHEKTFAVDCTRNETSVISNSQYAALRVKDAIVDQFRTKTGGRPSVNTDRPDVRIHLHVRGETSFVSIDLSGEGLHRRGYRSATGKAPLKETLAAAIVTLAGWDGGAADRILVDPMCGSGTLLIEAALIYGDSAPGLSRRYFGFSGWKGHERSLWESLVNEAVMREEAGFEKDWPPILGYDSDPVVVAAARKNVVRAGLEGKVWIKQADLAGLQRPGKNGLVVCNPPYGERLAGMDEVVPLYRALGRILTERFSGWRTGIFISNPDIADRLGISWEVHYRLYNGPIPCRLFVGSVSSLQEGGPFFRWEPHSLTVKAANGADFANRLLKNLKKILRWSEQREITCFRVYDRDIPEYNVSVDIYGVWVLVHEYSPASSLDEKTARERLDTVLAVIREILDLKKERIFIKTRLRQKGKNQYEKKASRNKMYEVREGGCYFLVNLTDYLDTGLFLDHRPLRERITREIGGKRFLNLFGYTGTATVAAAYGGAALTTTVDLSNTYLRWTRMNLSANGFSGSSHETVKADCLAWLQENTKKYDFILLDPPTFSNTKKTARVFDIQRDHAKLITLAMAHLDVGGLLVFSTNFKKFHLETALLQDFDIVEISERTIPFDFERNTKIHRVWEIRHSGLENPKVREI